MRMQKLILANGKMFHGGAKLSAFAGRRHNLTVMHRRHSGRHMK